VSLVAERGSAVRLSFGGGEVTIEAETQGRARAREIVHADFHGVEPVIAFSPHFLLDGIAAAAVTATATVPADGPAGADAPEPAGGFIRLEFNSSTKPAVITGVRAVAATPATAANPATAAGADAQQPANPGDTAGDAPDFRYLVVPLRTAARQ
jgi:DNA polymerase III beta subunit, C-terminal domain